MFIKRKPNFSADHKIDIVFLNINGVLNSTISRNNCKHNQQNNFVIGENLPAQLHIKWLNHITDRTGAAIVISSDWRKSCDYIYLVSILMLSGITGFIIDEIPHEGDNPIQNWLDNTFENINNYVVLANEPEFHFHRNNLINTSATTGLTRKNAKQAIKLLQN